MGSSSSYARDTEEEVEAAHTRNDQQRVVERIAGFTIDAYREMRADLNSLQGAVDNIPMTASQRESVNRVVRRIRAILQ